MATTRPSERRLARWTLTERAVHWVHAAAFLILLGSGLCLYLPSLAELVSRRPLLKHIHLYTALAWAIALVLIFVVGNRRALRDTVRPSPKMPVATFGSSIERSPRAWCEAFTT